MCGIVAALPKSTGAVKAAVRAMRERGPDHQAITDLGFASLGVARLAITDMENGAQPLCSASGKTRLVFNGAIYNVDELCRRFDLRLGSGNDGEVIHQLYERFGLDFAGHLDGMFAIILADLEARRLVIAVDGIGIKPLYYTSIGGDWFIASIPQAFPVDLAPRARRVPPGTLWSSDGEVRRFTSHVARQGSLGELLADSVKRQIPSEVPWGCLLSGGVDSSTVSALAARSHGRIRTFSCGLAGSEDREMAARVADLLGSEHHEEIVDPLELPQVLEQVVAATATPDPWVNINGVGTWLAARGAAGAGVKVLLSGEGADELFAGYDTYLEVPEYALNARLVHDQNNLGATECLRLDRCTMAHSIEARVPFLSPSLVRHARSLPAGSKISRSRGVVRHKPALRHFARSLLPRSIAERPKSGFSRGSGIFEALLAHASDRFTHTGVRKLQSELPGFVIDDPLSAWIHTAWHRRFSHLATDYDDMACRGLICRWFSPYQPLCEEPTSYSSTK